MSSILRKLNLREDKESGDKTTTMIMNGGIVLKELIASSHGKYNPCHIFSAKELKLATNNYDLEKVITQDLTYKLYKGFWQKRLISIMKFHAIYDMTYKWCINNIVYASQMSHKYILKLIGCCLETQIPILVFEYFHYGTLADRLYGTPQPQFEPLPLTYRLKIAMDIANAVAYLHLGFPRPIIFRDFNTSHILFNEENVAKLFDFSLSISIPEDETHVTDVVRGTLGFIPPEYMEKGVINEKSDVFSFGVFLMELLTGHKVRDIVLAAINVEEIDGITLLGLLNKFWKESRHNEIRDRLMEEDKPCPGKEQQWQASELLTGERIRDLSNVIKEFDCLLRDHAKKYFEENRLNKILDPLTGEGSLCPWKEQQLQAFVRLIFECISLSPVDRPTMVDVAKKLRQMYISCI